MNAKRNKLIAAGLAAVLLFSQTTALASDVSGQKLSERFTYGKTLEQVEFVSMLNTNYYLDHYSEYLEKGYSKDVPVIELGVDDIILPEDAAGAEFAENLYGRPGKALVWEDVLPYIEYEVDITVSGLYQISAEYYMTSKSSNNAVRSLKIDGENPFVEASSISFRRVFVDKGEPIVNSIGDETRPAQVEVYGWQEFEFSDTQGLYDRPFLFYLEKGKHKIRLETVEQVMVLGNLTLGPQKNIPTYAEVLAGYNSKGYKDATELTYFEAEQNVVAKNAPTLRRESSGDPSVSPRSIGYRKLNVIGGGRWAEGGKAITWEFEVKESGLYTITSHLYHSYNDGLPSYRQIAIDGEIPFEELLSYKFDYLQNKWQTVTLSSQAGEPFKFYLEKGKHTMTMTVKMGELTPLILSVNNDGLFVSQILLDIMQITGNDPDPDYQYEFFRTIPSLKGNLEALVQSLNAKYEMLKGLTDKLPAMANNFVSIRRQIEAFLADEFTIAKNLNDLTNAQSSLGTWYLTLLKGSLMIDSFTVQGAQMTKPVYKATLFQKLYTTWVNFIKSFEKDYNNVGSILDASVEVTETIDVWIARGVEWAETIKELADDQFTPKTGIQINVNVLPAGQVSAGTINTLMLAIISGRAPDVAISVATNSPVEFAIRDAVVDLKQFKDYEQVAGQFLDGIMTPFEFEGGVYALPETMDFSALFYRTDIIASLGIPIPDTREQLYSYVLPALYQNGLEFYYNKDYTALLFQRGGDFYTEDGYFSALDTAVAFQAFQEYTELYTHYGVPVEANFYNRFRTGQMPMGIGNFSLYTQLSIAAPELAGKWAIAPLPGLKQADGQVNRANGALTQSAAIILSQSVKQDESWEFLKWWMSKDTQVTFSREVEAIMGAEARWNTANLEAFSTLSFNVADLRVIEEQWRWARETPVVLGGYYTSRYVNNAWTTVVISGGNLRDALENAIKAINRELRTKQEEYGIYVERKNTP